MALYLQSVNVLAVILKYQGTSKILGEMRKADCTVPEKAMLCSASLHHYQFDGSQHSTEGARPDGNQ